MLKLDQYEFIRVGRRVYKHSIKSLCRMTGHSRYAVRKAIRGEPWGYREREHQPFPVLDLYRSIIDGWLEGDRDKPKKQHHTARRVYNRLVAEHGYQGCESTVRRYVRLAKTVLGIDRPGVFIPCDPEAGYEAEVDWGTATAVLSGEETRLKFFCMRSKFSGKHFVRFYPCERQQAFFDAHIHAFSFFDGVFPVLIYDNLTAAVRKVLQGHDRIEQESFTRFRAYYNFEARFCNRGQGHEKGGVEGLIGFARRNYMVPVPVAANLAELNEKILRECLSYGSHRMEGRDKTVAAFYEEEKGHLLTLPESVFSNVQSKEGRVDKYSTVIVDKNRYSVPTRYGGVKVSVLLHADRVEIFFGGKKVTCHERLYGNNKWCLDPDHYLDLLQERPLAFHSARPIRQWRESWPGTLDLLLERFRQAQGETGGIKDFITVLLMYRDYPGKELEAAIDLALESGISSSEGVRHILIHTGESALTASPLSGWPSLPAPDITVYGQLGGVQ